ncbi:MAG TPA: T9SS type A sorting domain-containing protein [Chitinophagaceae bacterium]|nr:T9SS type A sorting domain-containing protein [Chitinophagaceae bacterium]
MKQNLTRLSLSVLLVVIGLASFAQISNNATTIFLDPPSGCPSPAAGNYTLSISYFDLNSGTNTPIANYPAIVTYSGTTIVITASTANFPTASTAGYDLSQTTGNLSIGTSGTYFFDNGQVNCSALPVTLTSWGATVSVVNGYKQIHFAWSTASESNSCYYSIEWAPISNQVWQGGICRVTAAGNSSWDINYSFDWLYPQAVDYLFRLKMVDIDGSVKYSTIIRKTMSCLNGGSGCFRSAPNCSVTINGPNQVCFSSSASYTLSSLNDRGIAWSTSSSLASVQDGYSCTDNGAILNAGSSTGSVILSAKISGCSNTITKTIQIGKPINMNADKFLTYTYSRFTFYVTDQSGYQLYCDWYKNGSYIGSDYSQDATVYQGADCDEYVAKYNGPCGLQQAYAVACYEDPTNCDPTTYYTVSPIPANDVMTISPSLRPLPCYETYAAQSSEVYTLQILDMYGNLKKEKRNVSLKSKYQLNVSDLSDGNYILYLIDAKKDRITKQIKIQRN